MRGENPNMKIICSKDELIKGLNTVKNAVPARTPFSSFDCILIDASGEKISFFATDNEIGIETKIDGVIEEPGIVAINSKLLNDFIRTLRSEDIIIESDETLKTKISYLNTKPIFDNIMGKSGDEFKMIPSVSGNPSIEVTQYTLKDMISKTLFSVSDSETNRIMTGELFDIKNDKLRVISMDGHRISIKSTSINADEPMKVIIPSKALSEINKILGSSMEDKVSIYITSKYAIFIFNETKVYTTLLHGEFFNVDQMLSKDYSTSVIVNRQNLQESVGRANLLVRESDKKPTIFNITDNNMQIIMNTQIARFDEDIEISKTGNDLMIGFNPKFIIEALRAIDDDDVNMYFDGKISPLFIRDDEESYIYLILPINIMNENI